MLALEISDVKNCGKPVDARSRAEVAALIVLFGKTLYSYSPLFPQEYINGSGEWTSILSKGEGGGKIDS